MPRIACRFLTGLLLAGISVTGHASGTVPPIYNPAAPPIVKYRGVSDIYFDTPEQACIRLVEVDGWSLGSGGSKFDHLVQINDNQIWCHALAPWSPPTVYPFGAVNIMRSCDGVDWRNYAITCGMMSCPANSTGTPQINPTICTCNEGYDPDSTQTSCVTKRYSVTLIPDRPTTEPSQALRFTVKVKDQNEQLPASPVTVHLALAVGATSGGHDHGDSTRPRGGLNTIPCTSDAPCIDVSTGTPDNGTGSFTFQPTDASGTHTITPSCDKCSGEPVSVDVMVDGLWQIFESEYYALIEDGSTKIIGSTDSHKSNHYLNSTSQLQLWLLAQAFYEYQLQNGTANPTLLHLNDASLKWGGLFDKDGDWDTPHKEHRRGSVIDIRANSSPGAIPRGLTDKYIDIATRLGIDPHLEYDNDPVLRHFHTRLLNRKE